MNTDIELYYQQFETTNKLVGQSIDEISFYLEDSDQDLTEQPNEFGKSLLNGIDIKVSGQTFSIGNRYTSPGYGLSINLGQTNELEFFDVEKRPVTFNTSVVGQKIKRVDIYWMSIPFLGETGLYPQEIEIITDNGFLLVSSIEINNGQANTEFTNELLVIDKIETARQLKLGEFGIVDNDRIFYRSFDDLILNGKKNGL